MDGPVILSKEDADFAEFLGNLKHADWARILFRLSDAAKDDLRSLVGHLIGESGEDSE